MTFHIIKFAALTMLGWVLYRSLGAHRERACERPGPDSPRQDSGAEEPSVDRPREDSGAGAEPATVSAPQDLRKVRGIGPGIATLLEARGITTWARLAATEASDLQAILEAAGPRYRGHDPSTWPGQAAELAKAN